MRKKLFFTSFCFVLTIITSFAQSLDISGTWVLNLEKSKLEVKSEGFTGSKFIISQKGEKFYLTRYHYYGERSNKISFKMKADGKTRPVKLLFRGKLEPAPTTIKASIWKKNFSNIVDYSFGSSQNELIADEVMKSKHDNHHNIWVFDKVITETPK